MNVKLNMKKNIKMKMKKTFLVYIFSALSLLGFLPIQVFGGSLTMTSTSTLTPDLRDGVFFLTGTFDITNKGDEQAYDVFPSLKIGAWTWQGIPVVLIPNQNYRWTITEQFKFEGLKGNYPLLQMTHYKDTNGHTFSAPSIHELKVGTFELIDQVRLKAPSVRVRVNFKSEGETFPGKTTLENFSNDSLKVNVKYFSSDEISITPPDADFVLNNSDPVEQSFMAKNSNGTFGSAYPLYAIAQWESHGIHFFADTSEILKLRQEDHISWFITGTILSFLLASLVAGIYLIRLLKT
jgi:hypothetical protein